MTPLRIFVSYAHDDDVWFKRFRPLLELENDSSVASSWHDKELSAGLDWDQKIRSELAQMDIFICLVSVDFLRSKYIREVELAIATERYKKGEIEIVPVHLFPTKLQRYNPFLHSLHPLPQFGETWRCIQRKTGQWRDALFPIGDGLELVIDKVAARKMTAASSA